MENQFTRTELLLGPEAMERLSRSRVIVFGVGGVGGYVVEVLARSGVGMLALVDNDRVAPSNLNRQIIALHSTLGRLKVDVLEERIKALGMSPDDYKYYLDLRRYGSCRHAGFGLGFERMVMYLTGVSNIRDVELHPRTTGNADF